MADEINTAIDNTAEVAPVAARGTSLLEKLGLSSEAVLQAPNVESTISPKSTGALGILDAQETAAGIPSLRAAATEATRRRMAGEALGREEQLTIEGRRKKLGVLRGEQSQAAKQAALDIQVLLGGEQLAQGALTSGLQTAQQRAGILIDEYQQKVNLNLKFPGLDIDPLKDDFSKISRKMQEWEEDKAKDIEKTSYKDALRNLGLSTKGSRGELEDRLKDANKAEFDRAREIQDLELRKLKSQVANAEGSGAKELATKKLQESRERMSMQNDIVANINDPEFQDNKEASVAKLKSALIANYPELSPEEIEAAVSERVAIPEIVTEATLGSDFDFGRAREGGRGFLELFRPVGTR